jgi:hypothetical protein
MRGERARGTHWIESRVGPRTGLNDVGKRKFLTLLGLEIRPLGHPGRSQSHEDYVLECADICYLGEGGGCLRRCIYLDYTYHNVTSRPHCWATTMR